MSAGVVGPVPGCAGTAAGRGAGGVVGAGAALPGDRGGAVRAAAAGGVAVAGAAAGGGGAGAVGAGAGGERGAARDRAVARRGRDRYWRGRGGGRGRSEEHTSELQSLMHISYAVFCLTKKKKKMNKTSTGAQ